MGTRFDLTVNTSVDDVVHSLKNELSDKDLVAVIKSMISELADNTSELDEIERYLKSL